MAAGHVTASEEERRKARDARRYYTSPLVAGAKDGGSRSTSSMSEATSIGSCSHSSVSEAATTTRPPSIVPGDARSPSRAAPPPPPVAELVPTQAQPMLAHTSHVQVDRGRVSPERVQARFNELSEEAQGLMPNTNAYLFQAARESRFGANAHQHQFGA